MPQIRQLSHGPQHHFFGYYGMNPWDSSGRLHLALEVSDDRQVPATGATAAVGFIERDSGSFQTLGKTSGWNLQQGCMAHWIQCDNEEMISINDMQDGHCITRIINHNGDDVKQFDYGLCALAADGRHAYALDFARMFHCRRVVGYSNAMGDLLTCPDHDGIHVFDSNGANSSLLLSIADVIQQSSQRVPRDARCWINHVLPNADNSSVVFVCRYTDEENFATSLWSMNSDGSNLIEEIPFGGRVSHFCWLDQEQLLVSSDNRSHSVMRFHKLRIGSSTLEPYGGDALLGDSHLCMSPDGRHAVGDRYPDAQNQAALFLFDPADNTQTALGHFYHHHYYRGDIRCDLHPRWSADGSCISFDSIHNGSRQVYLVEEW